MSFYYRLLLHTIIITLSQSVSGQSFKQNQLRYERVRLAYTEQWPALRQQLVLKHINPDQFRLLIRAFKQQKRLEVWVQSDRKQPFTLFNSYKIVSLSGTIGPKRTASDYQTPEGFYHINRFNPASNFYLSLGIDYPNATDRKLGYQPLGSDIFIHGSRGSWGCLPIDQDIKEVYVLAVQARNAGQTQIPVHIFPFPLDVPTLKDYESSSHFPFWQSLQAGYVYFESKRQLSKW